MKDSLGKRHTIGASEAKPEGHSVPYVGFSILILLRESLSNTYIDSIIKGRDLDCIINCKEDILALSSVSASFCGGHCTSLYPHCCSNI